MAVYRVELWFKRKIKGMEHWEGRTAWISGHGNAIRYAPRGSIIALSCWRENADFVFTVTDSGPGISDDALENVFSRFESGGRQAQYAGAGLGLAIVESFVGLHHGKIFIDSEAGAGTTVSCRIPDAVGHKCRFTKCFC